MCFKGLRLARYTIFINSVSRTGEHLRGLRLANGNVLFGFREQNLARPQSSEKRLKLDDKRSAIRLQLDCN